MIIRINNRKKGIVDYLKTGRRADSEYIRDEKDKVIVITGDLEQVDKLIKYINKEKKYQQAYSHITISFTEKDFEKFYDPETDSYNLDKMQQLINDFMQLYLAGYDKNEHIYYAELHYPKIKYENGKLRLPHIHIVLPLLNLVSDTKLKPAFFSIKNNDLIQTYLAKKYDFDLPIYHKKTKTGKNIKPLSKDGLKRKKLVELLKDIKTEQELLHFFKQNNLQYRKVDTKKNCYYKIINPNGKDINLRGKRLEHLEEIARIGIAKSNVKERKKSIAEQHAQMSLQELKNELQEYIKKRVEEIGQRRSKKATAKLLRIKEQEQTDNRLQENSISSVKDIKKTFQERLLEEIYKKYIPLKEKGYYIKKDQEKVNIRNFKKRINIEDKGNILIARGKNLQEQVKLMLDLAEAKGWDLRKIRIDGSPEFKKEVLRQIKERLQVREQKLSSSKLLFKKENTAQQKINPVPRPRNYTEQAHKEKEEQKKLDKELIKEIKENLDPKIVLKYVAEHYKVDLTKYEIIGNKIKNLTNKQKPKNVIDFLQKEVGLSIKEAFEITNKLYEKQKLKENIGERLKMKLNYNAYTKIDYPIKNWKEKEIKSKLELETLVKTYPYSPFTFKDGYRSSKNTAKMTALVLDFDNDNKDYLISMQKVVKKLKEKGIKALLVETKSSGKAKNGIVAERFRVIIPITKEIEINLNNREEYTKAMELFTKKLNLYDYLDKGALKDIARMYRPSPSNAKSIVCNGNTINFENILTEAKRELIREQKEKEEQERREKEQRLAKLKELENNINAYIYNAGKSNLTGLTYADINKILSINFENLIGYKY